MKRLYNSHISLPEGRHAEIFGKNPEIEHSEIFLTYTCRECGEIKNIDIKTEDREHIAKHCESCKDIRVFSRG